MPGGIAAGTVLGLKIFLVLFDGAGPAENSTNIGQQITNKEKKINTFQKFGYHELSDCDISAFSFP